MNLTDYTYLLNKPEAINDRYAQTLDDVLSSFPYFQSARVLKLKHLYNQDSFQYNYALKVTAAYTTDRSILFDFITSDSFVSVQKGLYEKKLEELMNMRVIGSEHVVVASQPQAVNSLEQSILTSIKEAGGEEEQKASEKLSIGKPLEFSKNEKHSFQEWLQLSRLKPIQREEIPKNTFPQQDEKQRKLELIDKFIESNPKIPAVSKEATTPVIEPVIEDTSHLMTETLARVYLEQKKYSKAIQAYEILILKYPEKSSFFADRISDIKVLQQNNN
ncbi:tetratricopeptide repeat protein [Flavobacterium sedimenticola]|uniref:Tetratricopeptide repeat protein n=1 Tax=Flavobacterium sedimenticola TaxID=3043286 RepID=A0ABT6XS03_9FLAO|nr:tetratricopeptide repeat protein [Flavobacterium sedimenticola]MDI9257855.1 tetratricopeptide repeat protein [Flavobacterium sedimenticola]